jgi:hypothetical protein
MLPQIAAAAADQRVIAELFQARRDPIARRIVAAAVERPVVDAEAPADQPAALFDGGAAQRDIRIAGAKVADRLGGVELDHDLRVQLVELAQQRREEGDGENLFGGDAHRAAEIAGAARGGVVEAERRRLHGFGMGEQLFARGRQSVAGRAFLEQGQANGFLERGDAPCDGRLADAQLLASR